MFKPQEMSRVIIAGSKDYLERTIETLYKMRVLHITEFTEEDEHFKIGKPLERASPASEKLVKIRSASKVLDLERWEVKRRIKCEKIERELEQHILNLELNISAKGESRAKIESEIREIEDKMRELEIFKALPLSLEFYNGYKNIAVLVGTVRGDIVPVLKEITSDYEIFKGELRDKKIVAIFVEKGNEQKVLKTLLEHGFSEIKIPEGEGSVDSALERLDEQKEKLERKLQAIKEELSTLKNKFADFILACEEHLGVEVEKAEAPMKFATTENSFVVDGWVPARRYGELEERLRAISDSIFIKKLDERVEEEEIPIAYANPRPAKPFEALIEAFATPLYKEIDPTSIIFFTFPLFYGIMLGDVGYGLLIAFMVVSGIFTRLFAWLGMEGASKPLNKILLYSAISSIIFGIIYGEFFGMPLFNFEIEGEIEHGLLGVSFMLWEIPIPVHRFTFVKELLILTLAIGALHIALGLIIGFRNKALRDLSHASKEKLSWLFILCGGILALVRVMPALIKNGMLAKLNLLPSFMIEGKTDIIEQLLSLLTAFDIAFFAGMALVAIGIALLIKGEGFIAIMEIPTLLSNVLSYSRLLAIGLSSAGIALAFNTMSSSLISSGSTVYIIGGILILLVGHFINLLLGIIGPGLHALRLQYVEFFTKFYEGGGQRYSPFGKVRRYTEE